MYNFDMSAGRWLQEGRGQPMPVRNNTGIGIIVDFPYSEKCDPSAGPNWNGYLTTEISCNLIRQLSPKPNNVAWNKKNPMPLMPPKFSLTPKDYLCLEFSFCMTEGAILNYQSDTHNTDKTVDAGFRPFFIGATTRWWCNQRASLVSTEKTVILKCSLDPSNWFDVNGHVAGGPLYSDALIRPVSMGLTFGGGFYAGHGVNVSNGNAQFCLSRFYIL